MTDIHTLLENDHDAVRRQLSEATENEGSAEDRQRIFQRVRRELEVHMDFEEKTFYPAAREATGMVDEIRDDVEEHNEAKTMLDEIAQLDPGGAEWTKKVRQLTHALDHHIRDEEEKLFPRSRDKLNFSQREAMAADYEKLKATMERAA